MNDPVGGTVPPSPEYVAQTAEALRASRAALAQRSTHDVIEALGAAGARFLDPSDPIRIEALAALPAASGLSPSMGRTVLDGMAAGWTAEQLEMLVAAELGSTASLDGFVAAGARRVMALGPSLAVQIVAGSVPGVGVSALLRSLVVKGPTLLKPGRGDVLLPTLFARALVAVDPALAESLAVLHWPGGSVAHEAAALERADVAVVYGADSTVRNIRAVTPATTRLVEYHHRVSVGIVGRDALTAELVVDAASRVATAVAMYDQRGCVSPQIVYVEEGGAKSPVDFVDLLSSSLAEIETRLPSGGLDTAQASRLQQARSTAEFVAASERGAVRHGRSSPWTVVLDRGAQPGVSTAGRFVWVRPVADATDVPMLVSAFARHLQTVGVAGLGTRVERVATALGQVGASRVAPFESVAYPPAWWHHDGRGPLLDLVRWVDLER
jgi:hypothetical protein